MRESQKPGNQLDILERAMEAAEAELNHSEALIEPRPHRSRRRHQRALRRRQKRRQARARRLRTVMGLQFWTRTSTFLFVALCTVFWAKFALIYDIPENIPLPGLANITAYVTIKPWWFGPPVFDLAQTELSREAPYLTAKGALLTGLGPYQAVVLQPDFIWVLKR